MNNIFSSWMASLQVYKEPATLRMVLLGFSAGLPLLLVFGTLSFWLREAGIDRTTIGFLSWVALVYAFKWVWAPVVDRLPVPGLTTRLGRRRGWLLLAQVWVMIGLLGMALTDPQHDLPRLVLFALLTAFASATQDIALDAYRIESAATEKQAALAAAYQTGYRIAMIWAGAGVLAIAAHFDPDEATYQLSPWTWAYVAMAASMLVGVLTVLLSREPLGFADQERHNESSTVTLPRSVRLVQWVYQAGLEPFLAFFQRYRWQAIVILALIATYRMSDVVMGVMANPFYRDMGFSKEEVATVSKFYGVIMTLLGAVIGGVLALRLGVMRVLFAGAVLSAATNVLFAWLATRGHDVSALVFAVSADNLSAGLASAAFVAYLSGLTQVAYSATQYALFSSVMLLLPKFLAGFSGWAVDMVGYKSFFIATALMGLPVLVLVVLAGRARQKNAPNSN
jgi:PAT family beta-lactamase induction signal transducer AmpG